MNNDDNAIALADELLMMAQQLREAVDGEGDPPHPWRFDDWLACYRQTFDAPSNDGGNPRERSAAK